MIFMNYYIRLIIFILFFIKINCYNSEIKLEPKKTCLEHYLNGQSKSGIKPIISDNGEIFHIQCNNPISPESDSLVETIVHTALESWTDAKPGKKSTIGYQISNRKSLLKLIDEAENCIQELHVKWPSFDPYTDPHQQIIGFTVESVQGTQRIFQRNISIYDEYHEAVTLQSSKYNNLKESGILHILGTDANDDSEKVTSFIRVGPLICGQKIVEKVECLYELNEKSDWIKLSSTKNGRIQFSFRTDKAETQFLRILLSDGSSINIDLIDGYLLTVAHMIHPAKLLADGQWHTVTLDTSTLTLQVDGLSPIISFAAISEGNPLVQLQILLNGQVTGIKTGNTDTWICNDSQQVEKYLTEQILRKICPNYEDNYCNCQAPLSVISKEKCSKNIENGYYLSRTSNQLSFFYFDKFSEKSTVNVVFRSDSDYGLIMFGVVNNNIGKTRIQIHYINDKMQASVCTRNNVLLSDKCRSCYIKRKEKYSNNQWITVSYFHYNDYQFMSVDSDICRLAPEMSTSSETLLLDGATLYEVDESVSSALFIGGTYYTKNNILNKKINKDFRRKFYDHTNEKSPSLRGCINSIVINKQNIDLKTTLDNQINVTSINNNDIKNDIFSITEYCHQCISNDCNGATCRSMRPNLPEKCDCSSIYSTQLEGHDKCYIKTSPVVNTYGTLSLTNDYNIIKNSIIKTPKIIFHDSNILEKLWMLLLLPQVAEEIYTILSIGGVNISVSNYGKKVIIDISSIRETFDVITNDNRLHLIAIEKMSATGTSSGSFVRLKVDSYIRDIEIEDIPIHSNHFVYITPISTNNDNNEEMYKYPGCLQELTISFNYRDNYKINPASEAYQKDLLYEYIEIINDSGNDDIKSMINWNTPCGIRDPSFWISNSSGYGIISKYDPYGESSTADSISILITVLVSILILIILVSYCYCRKKKTNKYRLNMTKFKPTLAKDEKQPLKQGFMDTSRSSTDHSHIEYSPPMKQNNNVNGINSTSPVTIVKDSELLEKEKRTYSNDN